MQSTMFDRFPRTAQVSRRCVGVNFSKRLYRQERNVLRIIELRRESVPQLNRLRVLRRYRAASNTFRLFVSIVLPQTFWSREPVCKSPPRKSSQVRLAQCIFFEYFFFSAHHILKISHNSIGTIIVSSFSYIPVICIMRTQAPLERLRETGRLNVFAICASVYALVYYVYYTRT